MRFTEKKTPVQHTSQNTQATEICPVVSETLSEWANAGSLNKGQLLNWLSGLAFSDIENLKDAILASAELWELQAACLKAVRKEKPWAFEESSRYHDEWAYFQGEPATKHMANWIAAFNDVEAFRKNGEACLKSLPISVLQMAITDRSPKDDAEAFMISAEKRHLRGLERAAKKQKKQGARYVLQPLSELPKTIEKAAKESGVTDAFHPKHFNVVDRQNLENLKGLTARFPNAEAAIDLVYDQLFRQWQFGNDRLKMQPIILSGEPGVGKTRLCREIAKALNIDVTIRSVAGHADANIFGVSAGWSTAMPSVITKAVCSSAALNPLVMIDELDKALPSHNGSVWAELLGLLENTEAQTFYERFLAANVNASHICWLFTANDVSKLPRPLPSRCLVVHVDSPRIEQVPLIIQSLKADYAQELGVDERMFGMTLDDHDWLLNTLPEHQSIRVLSELLKNLIDRSQALIASA